MKNLLWYRLGDNAEYHHVGNDLDAMASVLAEADIGDDIHLHLSGIASDNYSGDNYISLYWGDKDAEIVRHITQKELNEIVGGME